MATIHHIVKEVSWLHVKKHVQDKVTMKDYKKLFDLLQAKNPVPNTENVHIVIARTGEVNAFSMEKPYSTIGSLNNQWLGYTVTHPESMDKPTITYHILTHILKNKELLITKMDQLSSDFSKFK